MRKEALLIEFVWIAFFSLIVAAVIYSANSSIIVNSVLSQQDLLFLEGLLLVVFGCFFLVVQETRMTSGRPSVRRLLTVGTLWTLRSKLKPNIIRVTMVLVSTGVLLIVISLL